MAFQLSPDLKQRIQAQITSGRFQTEEADADLMTGRVAPFDAEQTKRAVREQLRVQGITD